MTVDIVGIGDQRLEFKTVPADRFESSPQQYENIAKRLIGYYAPRYGGDSLVQEMLSSDDIISNIATQLMMADWRWDSGYRSEDDKVRSQRSYRMICGIWAIRAYIARRKKAHRPLSLSYNMGGDDEDFCMEDAIADEKQVEPPLELIQAEEDSKNKEEVRRLMEDAGLSVKEELALRLFYIHDNSQVGVAKQLGITRQRAQQLIQNALKKVKRVANG